MAKINQDIVKLLPQLQFGKSSDREKERWFSDLQKGVPLIETFSATIDPGSVAADSFLEANLTVTGVKSVDICLTVGHPELTDGLFLVDWWVDTDDVVSIVLENETTGAIDNAAGTWYFVVLRRKTTVL